MAEAVCPTYGSTAGPHFSPGPELPARAGKAQAGFQPVPAKRGLRKIRGRERQLSRKPQPEQMNQFIRSEIERAKSTFQRAGLKPQ
jgi:tripartite-type tricarboxylate transporter receptor subunit TctC